MVRILGSTEFVVKIPNRVPGSWNHLQLQRSKYRTMRRSFHPRNDRPAPHRFGRPQGPFRYPSGTFDPNHYGNFREVLYNRTFLNQGLYSADILVAQQTRRSRTVFLLGLQAMEVLFYPIEDAKAHCKQRMWQWLDNTASQRVGRGVQRISGNHNSRVRTLVSGGSSGGVFRSD